MIRSETTTIGPAGESKIVKRRRVEVGPVVYEYKNFGGRQTRRIYLKI